MGRAPKELLVLLGALVAVGSARASTPVVVPLRLDSRFPIVMANVDGLDVPLILDTGDSTSVILQQPVLDRIKAVPIPGESFKGVDAKGSVVQAPKFRISRLELGGALFTDVVARAEVHAPTMPAPDVHHKGLLGTGLLKAYEVILDYAHLTMTLVPHTANDTPSELCRGVNVPFAASQAPAEPVTKVDTDLGQLALWWDTASGFSFVSQKVVERGHVQASKEDVRTQRLVFGGFDFGPWRFKWMDMSLPPFFDGSIGHDFFATHVVCIDFPDRRLVIQP
jgi:hypothetical protein